MQGSYSFELFNFQDFFHDLFRFIKTLGLVVNLKTLLLIAAEIHFANPGEKDSYKHHKLTQNSVSFSCQSKQKQLSSLPVISGWIFMSKVSLKSKFLLCSTKTQHISYEFKKIELERVITWKLVTCQGITSKQYLTSMGGNLIPQYGQVVILVSGYPVLTAVNIDVQYVCIISFPVLQN